MSSESPDSVPKLASLFGENIDRRDDTSRYGVFAGERYPIEVQLSTYEDAQLVFETEDKNYDRRATTLWDYTRYAADGLDKDVASRLMKVVPQAIETIHVVTGERGLKFKESAWYHLGMIADSFYAKGLNPAEASLRAVIYVQNSRFSGNMQFYDEDAARAIHEGYQRTITDLAQEVAVNVYEPGIDAMVGVAAKFPNTLEGYADYKQIQTLDYYIADPLAIAALYIRQYAYEKENSEDYIDTANILGVAVSPFAVAANFSQRKHAITMLAQIEDEKLFLHALGHEYRHARSPIIFAKKGKQLLKAGFMTNAHSERLGKTIIMHRSLNEGFNERKNMQDLHLDPTDPQGAYYYERLVVDKLIAITGQELWDDYYSARSTFDKQYRQDSFRALSQSLGEAGGPGFLNRLDTTLALHGAKFVIDILDRKAYGELTYTPVRDLRRKAQELKTARQFMLYSGK